jgi:hypothetical protein
VVGEADTIFTEETADMGFPEELVEESSLQPEHAKAVKIENRKNSFP